MDQSVWQTIMSFDLFHSSYMWIQTLLPWGKQTLPNNADRGLFQGLRFCRRSWGFKIHIRWNIVRFWKSYIFFQSVGCVRNKLKFRTVQQNQKSFLWMQDWRWMVSPHLIYGIWSSQFLETRIRVIKNGETRLWTKREVRSNTSHNSKTKTISRSDQWFGQCWFYSLQRQLFTSGSFVVCVLKDNEAVIKMIIKGRSPTMRTCFPEHTELLLTGYLIESIWTPKSKSNTLTRKTNSHIYWPRGNFTRDEWNQIEANDEFSLAMQRKGSWRACLYCIRKPGENRIWKSTTSELMEWAASKNRKTCLWTTTWVLFTQHTDKFIGGWRWYGLWHRRRIRHVVNIQIILAQGEWSSAKDSRPILKRCNTSQ